jgi:hypothetical protein
MGLYGGTKGHFFFSLTRRPRPQVTLAVIEAIFESPNFRSGGYGGDFVMPGCVEYQQLHIDVGDYLRDQTGRLTHLDMPCAQVRGPACTHLLCKCV